MSPAHPTHVRAADDDPDDDQLVAELTGLLAEVDRFTELAERMALLSDARRLRILFCLHAHPGVRSSDVARVTLAGVEATYASGSGSNTRVSVRAGLGPDGGSGDVVVTADSGARVTRANGWTYVTAGQSASAAPRCSG